VYLLSIFSFVSNNLDYYFISELFDVT